MVTTKKVMAVLAVAILSMTSLTACSSNTTVDGYTAPTDVIKALDRVLKKEGEIAGVGISFYNHNNVSGDRFECSFASRINSKSDIHECRSSQDVNRIISMGQMEDYKNGEEWFGGIAFYAATDYPDERLSEREYFDKDFSDDLIIINTAGLDDEFSCYIYEPEGLSEEVKVSLDEFRNSYTCKGNFFD